MEERPKDLNVFFSEQHASITNVCGPRSTVWLEYLVILASEFENGMNQATCKQCKN